MDNLSTYSKLNMNPRKEHPESSNTVCDENTNNGEACQNNENAFATGQKPSNTRVNNKFALNVDAIAVHISPSSEQRYPGAQQ